MISILTMEMLWQIVSLLAVNILVIYSVCEVLPHSDESHYRQRGRVIYVSSLFSWSSLMIAETLAIPLKFNHICFCQWHPATRCQECTTPLFSSVSSLLCKANVISGSVSILTSPIWPWPWLCWCCFIEMEAHTSRLVGKTPQTLND